MRNFSKTEEICYVRVTGDIQKLELTESGENPEITDSSEGNIEMGKGWKLCQESVWAEHARINQAV